MAAVFPVDPSGESVMDGIVKLTDFMEISLITVPAKLLILGPGSNRNRVEDAQILVNLTVPFRAGLYKVLTADSSRNVNFLVPVIIMRVSTQTGEIVWQDFISKNSRSDRNSSTRYVERLSKPTMCGSVL